MQYIERLLVFLSRLGLATGLVQWLPSNRHRNKHGDCLLRGILKWSIEHAGARYRTMRDTVALGDPTTSFSGPRLVKCFSIEYNCY